MAGTEGGLSLRCDDCGGEAPAGRRHDDPGYPTRLKQFLVDHARCSFTASLIIFLPEQREPSTVDARTDPQRQATSSEPVI